MDTCIWRDVNLAEIKLGSAFGNCQAKQTLNTPLILSSLVVCKYFYWTIYFSRKCIFLGNYESNFSEIINKFLKTCNKLLSEEK